MAIKTQIGQIVYNLEDYAGSGGLLSTSATKDGDSFITISSASDSNYENNKVNIYGDIFESYGITGITKLGIQAPPGTKFYLNGKAVAQGKTVTVNNGQEIMIGRTGIYELDDDVEVKSLIFVRPKKYAINEARTTEQINTAITQMEDAKIAFDEAYRALKLQEEASRGTMANENFWEQYDLIHDNYNAQYNAARVKYIQGLSGIYEEHSLLSDLKNVIIDFMFQTASAEVTN